jgi:membrane carboxypeptidase/penicillin-binding protein PbpC
LAARVFRSLPAKARPAWPAAGDELRHVTVCAVTGLPASTWCRHTRKVLLPREQYLHRRCAVHHPVKAQSESDSTWSVAERWPGTTRDWDLAKVPRQLPATGPTQPRRENLRILTPPDRAEFVLTGEPNGDRLRLAASTERAVPLHWYLDNRYLGESAAEKPLYLALEPGDHRLTCMNHDGAFDSIVFAVSLPAGRLEFRQD